MPVCVFRLDTDRSAVDESVRYVDKDIYCIQY